MMNSPSWEEEALRRRSRREPSQVTFLAEHPPRRTAARSARKSDENEAP
ncbi:MAG: hypothetical protein JWO25_1943 [Alphaproteobacteria bacterium]|nr:hypothetical protein [Alphaproteobacteria bacterium]